MSDRTLKILMIDDDEQILFALRAVFQFQGWEPLSAQDVPSGLELFRSEHPDLVLIDYHLPRINGVKGVRMIRELDGEVPIIVFTIDESQEAADQFIEAGAGDFELKPIKVPDIISRIRLHIRLIDSTCQLKDKKEERVSVATAKGIGLTTLELIEGAMQGSDEFLTVEAISQRTGLAYQTTYRYIVSPANLYGAREDQRKTQLDRDLNRSFPGDPEGGTPSASPMPFLPTFRTSSPTWSWICMRRGQAGRPGRPEELADLPIAGWIGDLVLDALLTSEGGELCGSPLTLYGSPPAGSINQTVTEQLGIPTVTVETYREEPLARRVQNHLEFVQYVYNTRWMVWGGGKAKQSAYHVFFALTGFAIWRTLRHLRRQSSHRMEISHEERKHREVLIRE